MKRVEVTWIDSTSNDSWDTIEGHMDCGHEITTIGYHMDDIGDFMVLVMNIDRDGGDCSMSMRIPKGCIRRVKPLI